MSTHQPLRITAHLQQGAALDVPFGISLDGLLASVARDRAKLAASLDGHPVPGSHLDGGLAEPIPADVALPLTRCPHADPWHWLATTAWPVDITGTGVARTPAGDPDVHHQHSRVRERIAEQVIDLMPASLPPASGRYRMRRMPVVTTPAAALVWQAVGDADQIRDLLSDVHAVGKRRGTGEGMVLGWQVEPHDTSDPVRFGHTHPTGVIGRPTPLTCAQALGLDADRTGRAGIRPPYWHPATQHTVLLPPPLG